MPFGRQLLTTDIVQPTRVSYDGRPGYKPGGLTLDLTTIPAASLTDTTHPDGSIIRAGNQFLRYGQVLTKITVPATDVVTINGSPTGGTFTLTINGVTTGSIAYNAPANAGGGNVQGIIITAIPALSGKVTVTGSAGGPYTIVFDNSVGAQVVTASGASLTGGTTPTATVVATAPGGDVGKFGPYDPAATDGRATLTKGEAFILDEMWRLNPGGIPGVGSIDIIGGVIDAGIVWKDRIIQSGVASHSLAAGPTLAELIAVIGVRFAEN